MVATVWLARDMIQEEKDVALKIIIPGDTGEYEYKMQTEILRTVQDTFNLLTCLRTFFLRGYCDDNPHRVLVFPLRDPSIKSLEEKNMLPSVATRMSTARQLLKALEQLHIARIVHRGELTPPCRFLVVHANYSIDLNDRNVMWDIAPLDNVNTETKYKLLGWPKKIALPSTLWNLGELVKPLEDPMSLLGEIVYLGDFGVAIKADDEVEDKVLWPVINCAPEQFHNANPSYASDMWSYIVLFIQLYLGSARWHSDNCVLLMNYMVRVLGPLRRFRMQRFIRITSPSFQIPLKQGLGAQDLISVQPSSRTINYV
jgi:serine/threonine protein kinase